MKFKKNGDPWNKGRICHKDISGQKFGMLTAVQWHHRTDKKTFWLFCCDCGKECVKSYGNVTAGFTKSCGCRRGHYSHGLTRNKKPTTEYLIFKSAHRRARRDKIPFNISVTDVIIPEKCPLLEIPLFRGNRVCHMNSPSLDKIIPALGYVKGNVQVISHRANWIKQDASLEELKTLVRNWENQNQCAS